MEYATHSTSTGCSEGRFIEYLIHNIQVAVPEADPQVVSSLQRTSGTSSNEKEILVKLDGTRILSRCQVHAASRLLLRSLK